MKTVYASESLSALGAAIQSAALANPVLGFAAVVILSAAFATWAARQF